MAHVRLVEGSTFTDKYGTTRKRGELFQEMSPERIAYYKANTRFEVLDSVSAATGSARRVKSRREREREASRKASAAAAQALTQPDPSEHADDTTLGTGEGLVLGDFKVPHERLVKLAGMDIKDSMTKPTLQAIAEELLITVTPEMTRKQLVIQINARQVELADLIAASGNVVDGDDAGDEGDEGDEGAGEE